MARLPDRNEQGESQQKDDDGQPELHVAEDGFQH
jgi:hypothetical protein